MYSEAELFKIIDYLLMVDLNHGFAAEGEIANSKLMFLDRFVLRMIEHRKQALEEPHESLSFKVCP